MPADLREGRGREAEASALARRHFAMPEARPAGVEEVGVAGLDPFLRLLLFTDGTVTRALGAQALAPVSVVVVEQEPAPVPASAAVCLEVETGAEAIRRRVAIGLGSSAPPLLWAESHLLAERLPAGFVAGLDGAPDGIGQSLHHGRLESWRELLWFGIDAAPAWAAAASSVALVRRYRLHRGGRPAILITESFAIERDEEGGAEWRIRRS